MTCAGGMVEGHPPAWAKPGERRRNMDKTCSICLYAATHEPCPDCLNTPEDYAVYRAGGKMPPMRYLKWEPGNARARLQEQQRSGARSIVIGWQGEAEVNVNDTPHAARAHLVDVAEQCGYMIDLLTDRGDGLPRLRCYLSHGVYDLVWAVDVNAPHPPGYVQTTHLNRIEKVILDREGKVKGFALSWTYDA